MDLGIYETGGARNILVHLIAAHPRKVIEDWLRVSHLSNSQVVCGSAQRADKHRRIREVLGMRIKDRPTLHSSRSDRE
jgi:hypothetical protein